MHQNWSKLRPLSKLDQLAEVIIKTAFIISEDHHVVQSYVEHKGPNFRVVGKEEASFATYLILAHVLKLSNSINQIIHDCPSRGKTQNLKLFFRKLLWKTG